ncbi:carbohydrate-binding protein [Dactylosporangium aurantiacum]|uniref:Carbohydrate-binding protein n=1 Tax=Dactylosporangium aurantiacum TaxID=35754 RepID=A0A9Q9IVH6_9ACTN|nr:CBM35 domain-containing protein [Dactylosporangium aurantiacum]MDG6107630.1 CBM35 domain-containing protein [Dactylosporangium aurantiacum]UWZ59698.1 carbohydrate-binding protein [Dactylosporangium aurantiacum]
MFSRRQRIALLSACTAATVGAGVAVVTTAFAAATRYEAENAPATCDGAIESNHTGYSGTGFCNANNAVGAAAQFTVTASAAGTATIGIRYANGTADNRPADVLVNGAVVQAASAFAGTGAWTTWTTKTLTATLNVGNNTIRLNPTTALGLANIDYVDVESGGTTPPPGNAKQMEDLDRGLISVRSGSGNLVSWRLLGTEALSTAFNLYRGGTRVATVTAGTNYLDAGAAADASYTVRAVVGGTEQAASGASLRFANGYLDVPISSPGSGYTANDASVGDLDGDGQYEIVLKWDPADAKDNSQSGVTGVVYVDAYRLSGQRLWRINLGRNIRAGAHYTQFQVYDYDGDGRAEVAMKTADATVDGTGRVIGNASADYRNADGYVLSGPEFLTMFNGQTGAAMSTVEYVVPRGTVSSWGDSYGNRVDRFLAGTAYLDGQRPSLIMARGYYTRSVIVAWDFRNGTLTRRWTFDSNSSGNSGYAAQGNHQLSVADVDADGRDEIVYGSMAVDDNGARLWNTGNGHGDAMHVGDLDPSRPGLEEFKVDEDGSKPSSWMADARTGQILWSTPANGDNGRGVSGDIWAGSAGAESWSSAADGVRNPKGAVVTSRKPSSTNFLAWWDGDTTRELLDGTHIDKYGTSGDTRLLTASGVHSNNGTKSTPSLSGDIFGDWREEVIWPTTDNTALRIYSTTAPTSTRLYTLMHDPQYRCAIAWQNTAYNQPPHPSYFIGSGMSTPPQPNIYVR